MAHGKKTKKAYCGRHRSELLVPRFRTPSFRSARIGQILFWTNPSFHVYFRLIIKFFILKNFSFSSMACILFKRNSNLLQCFSLTLKKSYTMHDSLPGINTVPSKNIVHFRPLQNVTFEETQVKNAELRQIIFDCFRFV